jgi:hypothetical protein
MTGGTRYQGEHWRRVARLVAGVWIAIVLGPGLVRPRPIEQMLAGVVFVAVLLLLAEWPLARRLGFTVAPEGLTLHTALGRRRLRWDEIDHFAWQQRRAFQCLYALAPDGRRTLIPTLQRGAPGWRGRFLGSSRVRARDGRLADALEVLETALDAARRSPARAEAVAIGT